MNFLQRITTSFQLLFNKRYTIPEYLWPSIGIPFGYGTNDAGEPVTVHSGEKITTVFNAINVIAQDIATADVRISRKGANGVEVLTNDPLEKLLDGQPNPYMNAYQFKYCMTFLGESRGESYAWIERDGNMRPVALWPLDPDQVVHMQDKKTGLRWFEIAGTTFSSRDVFCYYTFSIDGYCGYSKILWNAQNIGLKMKTHRYKNNVIGTQINGFLKGDVTSEQAKDIAKAWKDTTSKGNTPFLAGKDLDYKQLMFTPEQTDIVMSEKWTDTMTLGIFRVQPVMVGIHEDSNYSNAEQQSLNHVMFTLNAPRKAWEQECNSKLVSEREKMGSSPKYVQISFDHFLRGDNNSLMEKIRTMVTLGIWNADRVLDELGEPHQEEGGEKYYIQGAMIEKGTQPEGDQGERMMREINQIIKKYQSNGQRLHTDN